MIPYGNSVGERPGKAAYQPRLYHLMEKFPILVKHPLAHSEHRGCSELGAMRQTLKNSNPIQNESSGHGRSPPLPLLLLLSLPENPVQFLQMILPWRGKNIDPLESGFGFTSVLHIGRMNADIAGLHQELLVTADVFLLTLQHDENLLRGVTVQRKYATRRILDETQKHVLPGN